MQDTGSVEKLRTFVPGLDHVAGGGIPAGRTTLVSGTAGSAKSTLAAQFLAGGIREAGEPGVFVTFEEPPADLRRNLISFGWDVARWENEDLWAFVDASPEPEDDAVEAGSYDMGALLARIRHAVERVGAKRVSIDSIGAVFTQFEDSATVRRELFRISAALKRMELTAILTSERSEEYGSISRYGVEEFVADNVIVLRNALALDRRRRTLEILKFRGTTHYKGEIPFTVVGERGVVVIPLSALELTHRSTSTRTPSGSPDLDTMCGGGFFRDSMILVSGATGTGKTLLATEFIEGGVEEDERCLLFGFEESPDQLRRNASGWGVDFASMEQDGLLRLECRYPETAGLEDHLIAIREAVEDFKPARVAVDSLSALERVSTERAFREFIIALTSFLKSQNVTGLFTATSPNLLGGSSVTEAHISTITDSIILLRYVESYGAIKRGLAVLKMRGSPHDHNIREFMIDGAGMHIGDSFQHVTGLLAGHPEYGAPNDSGAPGPRPTS
ncbi:MAG: circadian clock protein KaiC [Gemmatimonadota bacterium]|nr:circadian clock protein KaiC [Gemmatimonadota bacterium]